MDNLFVLLRSIQVILPDGFLYSVVVSLIGVSTGIGFYFFLFHFLLKFARKEDSSLDLTFVRRWKGPARIFLPMTGLSIVSPVLVFEEQLYSSLSHLFQVLLIITIAYFLIQTAHGFRDFVVKNHDINVSDNLKARTVHTQICVLVRIADVVIMLVGFAAVLMTFDAVRQIGVSLLASAGVIGVILGFAAQKSIATLFSGIQLALTQPIRLDDVLVLEGEWGRVEEITLTYVVVRIWDLRRLVVPVSYFLEQPFQNWTRTSSSIMGSVSFYTDYSIPVDILRGKIAEFVQQSSLWDGVFFNLQVIDSTEKSMQLRVLVTASDSSKAWDLRCELREKILLYIQSEYPGALPRVRAEFSENMGKGVGSVAADG